MKRQKPVAVEKLGSGVMVDSDNVPSIIMSVVVKNLSRLAPSGKILSLGLTSEYCS